MKIKAIFLDLDGTLNNDAKLITPRTRAALMELQQKEVRLVLASARPTPGLFKERDTLRIGKFGGILMAYNGGQIVEATTGKVLYERKLDMEAARKVLRFLETQQVTPILDDGKEFFVTDPKGYKVEYECQNNRMKCNTVKNLADFLNFNPNKILMSADPAWLPSIRQAIRKILPEGMSVVQTAPFYLEVIPRDIHKGMGLLRTCKALDIDPKYTLAFGDAENDISMLEAAGVGIAMGNATQTVKAAAKDVTGSNNEDGIAQWLEKYKKYL